MFCNNPDLNYLLIEYVFGVRSIRICKFLTIYQKDSL